MGYSVRISWGGFSCKWVTLLERVKDGFVAHDYTHTCDPRFQKCGDEEERQDGEEDVQVSVKKVV